MSKKPFKLPPGVHLVSLKKCTLAFFLDMAFTVILMVSLYYSVGVNVILPASDYSTLQKANENLYRESELVEERNNNGQFYLYAYKDTVDTPEADYAYKKYINLVWDYFIDKVPNNPNLSADVSFSYVGTDNENHRLEGFKGEAKADNAEYGKWIYMNFFGFNLSSTANNFYPSEENNFLSKPTADPSKHNMLGQLMNQIADNGTVTGKGFYALAATQLSNQPFLAKNETKMRLDVYVSTLPTFVVPPLIFFFIIPLCLSNGRTLGKLICGEAVIAIEGYSARKIQIVVRQFTITLMWLLLALPWQVVAWPLFMLVMLLDYMTRVMSKRGQAIHDKFAGTVAIDGRKSVWFASQEEENQFVEEHPASPISKSYRKEEYGDTNSVITSAAIEAEERILDLSTINKRRAEARNMTSFDEFERQSDAEFAAREEEAKARAEKAAEASADEEPVDEEAEKAALKDLAALEGLTEEEAAALAQEDDDESVENLAKPQETAVEDSTDDGSDDADGFTDGGK